MRESTKHALSRLLKTNTGRHMLDSGGAYGRHWERNQKRTFSAEPETLLEFRVYTSEKYGKQGEIECSHNLYHWLAERVDYLPEFTAAVNYGVAQMKAAEGDLNSIYHPMVMQDGEWTSGWFEEKPYNTRNVYVSTGDVEEFMAKHGAKGIYGDGGPVTENTYNGEEMLSQVIQFCYFTLEDEVVLPRSRSAPVTIEPGEYVALQIHGGCDVRGGYTSAELFSCSIEEYSILDYARAFIWCDPQDNRPQKEQLIPTDNEPQRHSWYTDDGGYRWYGDGSSEGLHEVEFVDADTANGDNVYYTKDTAYLDHKLFVDEDGNGYCPYCGGPLHAGSY